AFLGNNGTLVLNRSGWEVIPEIKGDKPLMEAVPHTKPTDNAVGQHMENFVEAVRSGNLTNLHAPIEAGAEVANIAQMGNISYRTGERLQWDEKKRQFNSRRANKYLAAE